jgi:hypothetical protein
LERAGDFKGALAAYKAVPAETEAAIAAAFRVRVAESPNATPAQLETVYTALSTEAEREAWMLVSGKWDWMSNRRAARMSLVELRSTGLSFRFFSWLRFVSPFRLEYSYLFAILAVTIVVHTLMLPLWFRWLQAGQLNASLLLVQAGAAIWLANSMDSFAPQMALDQARFLWVADVTQANMGILGAFVLADLLCNSTLPEKIRPSTGQTLIISVIIAGLGWLGKWGAYWLLCVIALRMLMALSNIAMKPFLRRW